MSADLKFQIRSLSRLIYFQTDEEDRFLKYVKGYVKKDSSIKVFNATMGLHPIDTVTGDWQLHKHPQSTEGKDAHALFEQIYTDSPKHLTSVYIITDPERWLPDLHIQRRILNIVHALHNDVNTVKILIFVGQRRVIPEKLSRYMEVVVDNGLSDEEIEQEVMGVCTHLNLPAPDGSAQLFRGLTTWEIKASIAQSVVHTKMTTGKVSIEPGNIVDYRRKSLRKSDLLSYVDTKDCSFENVGGLPRFKEWCTRTKSAWSEEGRKFGLVPPKGVLAVGVWGCGKSISVKAMGQAWGLPVVALEMGKLRGMAQGVSESNVYTALKLIEQVSPCVVWIDEAEKSLSGGQSSAMTDGGTTNRMIGIFSTWLQETHAPVTLALTANSLGTLPIEFVNRMDERFFFDLPAHKDRIEILKIHISKLNRDPANFDMDLLAKNADQLVGREMEQAVKAALRDSFFAKKGDLDEKILATELLRKPRISKTMADEIQSLIQWVGFDPEADDGIRARYAAPPTRKVKTFEGT